MAFANVDELERRLHHTLRRVAKSIDDAIGQGAVVGADAHGNLLRFALEHQRRKTLGDPGQLGLVLAVGIGPNRELAPVDVVAGIDPDLLDVLGGLDRGVRRKVNVRDERNGYPMRPKTRMGKAACLAE